MSHPIGEPAIPARDMGEVPSIQILGMRVHMAAIPDVITLMRHWIQEEPQRYHHVVHTGMHGIMEGHRDQAFRNVLNSANLLAPDGILALTVARFHGYRLKKRDSGPELMWRFSEVANQSGFKYFLYGDTPDTLAALSAKLAETFHNVKLVGNYSPPYRPATGEEDDAIVGMINQANPDVLWVALGMPRQEQWIWEHREKLKVPVAVGAGASFKFLSGMVRRAPPWVRNSGFEWLWRLLHEPGLVWRRVFVDAPQFVFLVTLQLAGLRKFG